MKIARFSYQKSLSFGVLDEKADELVALAGDPLFGGFEPTGQRLPLQEVTLLAPVIPRSKVVAVGKNYRDHAAEFGGEAPDEPLLFFKPNTAVIGPEDEIVLPEQSAQIDYEGELAVVIGRIAKNVAATDFSKYVLGYTVANDVTARDLQASDGQWARAKGFDTFCPLGPYIETEFEADAARVVTRLNGIQRQNGAVADLVHSIAEIVEYVTAAFTMLPGDVILTGTPAGVGPMVAGDRVEVEIEGIGTLGNPITER